MFCLCCSRASYKALCVHCRPRSPIAVTDRCSLCFSASTSDICEACRAAPLLWRQLRYLYPFPEVRHLIHQAKFHPSLRLAQYLGGQMAQHLLSFADRNWDAIVPAPLSPESLQRRKFNQSLVLAQVIGTALKLPVRVLLGRVPRHSSQSKRKFSERHLVLNDVFLRNVPMPWSSVLLIDDLITTGFTAHAACQALLSSGTSSVDVYTFASATHRSIFPFQLRKASLLLKKSIDSPDGITRSIVSSISRHR